VVTSQGIDWRYGGRSKHIPKRWDLAQNRNPNPVHGPHDTYSAEWAAKSNNAQIITIELASSAQNSPRPIKDSA